MFYIHEGYTSSRQKKDAIPACLQWKNQRYRTTLLCSKNQRLQLNAEISSNLFESWPRTQCRQPTQQKTTHQVIRRDFPFVVKLDLCKSSVLRIRPNCCKIQGVKKLLGFLLQKSCYRISLYIFRHNTNFLYQPKAQKLLRIFAF